MKKYNLLVYFVMLFIMSFSVIAGANSGAIWTTNNDCGSATQDANHYAIGAHLYINGNGFNEGTYDWEVYGNPGGSSADPNIVVASGTVNVDSTGSFCFYAYTVQPDDDGEYKFNVGGKNDNYRVQGTIF
ncbi:MAG TPA: hypothetical protein V6C58_21285, partial [Allocoleopsis sp.]